MAQPPMKIAVLGAGAWGTALAIAAAARHDVLLWARDAAQAARCSSRAACNRRYLPEVALPTSCRRARPAGRACACRGRPAGHGHADVRPARPPCSLARGAARGVAVQGLRGRHRPAGPRDRPQPAAWRALCVLSGPSFALEVARGQPTALVAASESALAATGRRALHGDSLRIYTATDIVGVEVGGAVKNVMAIATGMLDGWLASGAARRAGAECARRADHARPGRDDAPGRGPGRPRRDLHGPVGPGRPGAHRHRRPVAQPQGRPAAGPGLALAEVLARWAMWPKASTPRARWPTARRTGRGHADHAGRGRRAGRPAAAAQAMALLMARQARAEA
jgi:hypothetical protein